MTQTKAELLQTKNQGDIRLGDADSSHYVGFKAPTTVSANKVWTLPAADGSANQLLTTNGSGVLSWSTVAAGGGTTWDSTKKTLISSEGGGSATPSASILLGEDAGESVGSGGSAMIAIGSHAGAADTNGYDIFIGHEAGQALTGGINTIIGHIAGGNSTGGAASNNTFLGNSAGHYITSGSKNTYLGGNAGLKTTTGNDNTSVGIYSSQELTTGTDNVALGYSALYSETTGQGNVAIGKHACHTQTGGTRNTGVGTYSMYAATGDYNVAVGRMAGYNLHGDNNTAIGYNCMNDYLTGSNCLVLGSMADPSAQGVSNEITLGDNAISTLRCQVTSITALSDRRDKTDINTLDLGLNFINALNPVKFKWNSREGILKDGSYEAGFIAQDFQESQKDFNAEYLNLVLDTNPEKLEAAPGKLIPIMVQAIKELSAEVQALKNS